VVNQLPGERKALSKASPEGEIVDKKNLPHRQICTFLGKKSFLRGGARPGQGLTHERMR